MVFTPSPGTGDLIDVNPLFVDTLNWNFSLQAASPAIASGKDGYDRGAIWFVNRPQPVRMLDYNISDTTTHVILSWDNPTMMLDSTAIGGTIGAKIYRNDSLIANLPGLTPGAAVLFDDYLPGAGNYQYAVSVYDAQGREGIRRGTARRWGGGLLEGIVVWALDPNPLSQIALTQSLNQMGYAKPVFQTSDPNEYELTGDVDAVFVLLGVRPNAYLLGNGGSNRLINYLTNGGNVYLEGGDFWSNPNQQMLGVYQYFHILCTDSGQADLFSVQGEPGTFMDGLHFTYSGENVSIDEITSRSGSEIILRNPADTEGCAIAYSQYPYHTIGASFQFGGLDDGTFPNTRQEYLQRVLNYFGVLSRFEQELPTAKIPAQFSLQQNYPNPFNSSTLIRFQNAAPGNFRLEISNLLGQSVLAIELGKLNPGRHNFRFNSEQLSSGIYFYRILGTLENGQRVSAVRKMLYAR